MLRQSGNDFVRSNIFINADLTPAEALAAYEARCARRQRRAELREKTARNKASESIVTGELTVGRSVSEVTSVVRYPRYLDTYRRYLRDDTSIAKVTIYRGIS